VTGVIQGGWEYVQAAYLVTAAILIGYVVSLYARHRAERDRRQRERGRA
jgi:hypothetical protein